MPLLVTAEQVAATTVRYTWSGEAPYDVWLNGARVLRQTNQTAFVVEYNGEGAEPWIEVLDANDSEPAQSELYSPILRIQWRGRADATGYTLERFNVDTEAWEPVQFLVEAGRGYCWTKTLAEIDGIEPEYRVVARDARDYESPVVEVTRRIVCNPRTPVVAGTYDSDTGELTVDE